MAGHDIIVVGASAGGVETLQKLVALLPPDLPASVFVVQHTSPRAKSQLPLILDRKGPLPASFAEDGQEILLGHIYVAPADCHLLVEPQQMRVVRGPRENRHRPAIDPLFRSAAWAYGPRVVGVVLTGYLDDGTAGLWAIRTCGGVTVVQSSDDALYPEMPLNAARAADVDHSLPVSEIAPLLDRLAREPVDPGRARKPPASLETEIEFAKMDRDISDMGRIGTLSPFTCPACRGSLWELDDGGILRYRCHTGHAFSAESLVDGQSIEIEEALYSALRALEEKATVLRRLHERVGAAVSGLDYETRASELDQAAEVVRGLLAGRSS
ncbi:MAG: chemotaxis protein CheB [Gemmatimonadales bacterium]